MDKLKISNSELQCFKDCRRKWWLTYYRELGPKKKEHVGPRSLGTRVHVALYEYYVNGADPLVVLAHLADEEVQKLTETDNLAKFNSEIELAKRMVGGYLEWLEETGMDSELEVISGETYLERQFSESITLMGKVDARILHIPTGERWVLDNKTVQNFEDHLFNIRSNEQMLYYLLIEAAQPEGPCVGSYYNMLRKVKRSATAKPPFYMRREIRYNSHQRANFETRLRGTINDLVRTRELLDNGVSFMEVAYPRPSKDCSWKCDFLPVCPLMDDGSRWEAMLAEVYEKVDPHAHYSTTV